MGVCNLKFSLTLVPFSPSRLETDRGNLQWQLLALGTVWASPCQPWQHFQFTNTSVHYKGDLDWIVFHTVMLSEAWHLWLLNRPSPVPDCLINPHWLWPEVVTDILLISDWFTLKNDNKSKIIKLCYLAMAKVKLNWNFIS